MEQMIFTKMIGFEEHGRATRKAAFLYQTSFIVQANAALSK